MSLPLPVRHFEPNIVRSPFEWMGIWTPQGWRTHRKRFGTGVREEVMIPVRPGQTYFPGALRSPSTGAVEWRDDLHLQEDPFCDGGIYPCDPRVESPPGNPRWSVSHSLLCFPVADHSLFTHEYTWDMVSGDLSTHFRRHIALEECRTDSVDGGTVKVRATPISQTIEGNVAYDIPNSAVRGVWTNPDRRGPNLYSRRAVQKLSMHNGTYVRTPHCPVLQCRGVWQILPEDSVEGLFDAQTGHCHSLSDVAAAMLVPLDEPKLSLFLPESTPVFSQLYGAKVGLMREPNVRIDATRVEHIRRRLGVKFDQAQAGYAGGAPSIESAGGYFPEFDFNDNGEIDEFDLNVVERHLGREMRSNLYVHSYFGPDWLSICVLLDPEQQPGQQVLADYDYGAGYDARAGVISLFESPGPDEPVWVEYYSDAPKHDEMGTMRLTLYNELP